MFFNEKVAWDDENISNIGDFGIIQHWMMHGCKIFESWLIWNIDLSQLHDVWKWFYSAWRLKMSWAKIQLPKFGFCSCCFAKTLLSVYSIFTHDFEFGLKCSKYKMQIKKSVGISNHWLLGVPDDKIPQGAYPWSQITISN
jgi:hypothetical protein